MFQRRPAFALRIPRNLALSLLLMALGFGVSHRYRDEN
jgi:hypothetical protein